MTTTPGAKTADQPENALPPFYREPQPLSSVAHANWRLKNGDMSFAADAAYVPIVISEFVAVSRCCPIVFSAGASAPVALLGLERRNLFVEQGVWEADSYVPAYVRRYPFGFMATTNPDGFALAIDAASDLIVREGTEGMPLFEDGKPSELTRQAMAFCDAFQGEAQATLAFGKALAEAEVLIDRRADATLPDGRKLGVDGFCVVDEAKLAKLDEAVVLDWHRKGWLALVYIHLASLERFQLLLARQSRRAGEASPVHSAA